jgi:GT2 family glycosyltransferase
MSISIIVPVYNKASYIARCLDSIAAQTFQNFEVIVVDDGSTDGSSDIVAAYPDPRIRLVRQANAGPGAARNRGAAEARFPLLAFLDADDEWLPGYLEHSFQLLEEHGEDVASVSSGYIEEPAGISREPMWRSRGMTEGVHVLTPQTSPVLVMHELAYMSPWSTVIRAEALKRWGGFYDREKSLYGEDSFLFLKVLLNEKVVFSLTPLTRFHTEASSLSFNLEGPRPVEPFLRYPEEIESVCPAELRDLLSRVLAAHATKTAFMLGYWGRWREAKELRRRFPTRGAWRVRRHFHALICSTPVGASLARAKRAARARLQTESE